MAITETGVYPQMPDAVYHADPAPVPSLSAGTARRILQATPRHVQFATPRLRLPTDQPQDEDRGGFDIGAAAHAILTGKGGLLIDVPFDSWRKTEAKDLRDEAWAQGHTPLLTEQAERVRTMIAKLDDQMLDQFGYVPFRVRENCELAMFWQEALPNPTERFGQQRRAIWCRSKPDCAEPEAKIAWDYKTSDGLADPGPWTITQNRSLMIALRATHYLRGLRALYGGHWRYRFVVQENKPPHCASVIELSPSTLETGLDQWRKAAELWEHCVRTGEWKAWGSGVFYASAGDWDEANWVKRRGDLASAAALAVAREAMEP